MVIQHVYFEPRYSFNLFSRQSYAFGLLFCQYHESLNDFVFELELVSHKWCSMGQCSMHSSRGDMHKTCTHCSLHNPFAYGTPTAPGAQHSGKPAMRLKASRRCYIQKWVSGGVDSPKRTCFPLESQFVSNAERRWWHSNTKNKEPCHILSHLYYFPVLASHLYSKWRHRRKGEDKAAHRSLSLQLSLTQQ